MKRLVPIAILAGILSLAAVACGGGDDQEAPAAAAPAAAEPTPAATINGDTPVSADLSQESGTVDLTVHITEIMNFAGAVGGKDFVPSEMTFKVGQTVNFTLVPPPESTKTHSFTVFGLGINQFVKYGKPATVTYTFDKPGTFRLISTTMSPEFGRGAMKGTITVVE